MPKVRYTYMIEGQKVREEDILPHVEDITLRGKQQVMLWNEKADERGEEHREFISAEVLDPFIHEHEWQWVAGNNSRGLPSFYRCQHCPVTGKNVSKDGERVRVIRNTDWTAPEYDYCREKLPKPRPFKAKG